MQSVLSASKIKKNYFDSDLSGAKVANACQWRKLARKSRYRRPLVAGASGRKKNAILAASKILKVTSFLNLKASIYFIFLKLTFE
jgi:hypothetical protein